ncbi:hypothetical protein FRB98_002386 [Tulasnella sp. 332]|nr:hypothetical protein FRB98_002386 [Tulasnella sp. 332]
MSYNANPTDIVRVPVIDSILETYIIKPEHGLSGVAAVAVNRSGEVVYSGAFGRRSLDPLEEGPMRLDTVNWIASQTKLMTAIAVMQCVERGQIGLDDDVGKVCPDLANPEVIEGFNESDGTPNMRKATTPLTFRNLLSHTSGFSYNRLHPNITRWIEYKGLRPALSGEPASIDLCKFPLVGDPGSGVWLYGAGVHWVGQVVECLNNCRLGEYMEKNIWKPLGMNDTTFRPENRPDFQGRMIGTCLRSPDGRLVSRKPWFTIPSKDDLGGSEYSFSSDIYLLQTCSDYAKFLTTVLQDGGGILTKASIDEIFKPQYTGKAPRSIVYNTIRHDFGR